MADTTTEDPALTARGKRRSVRCHGVVFVPVGPAQHHGIVCATVEHGTLFTEEDVRLVAERGTWLVSTDGVGQVAAELPDAPEHYRRKAQAGKAHRLRVRRWARQYGARVALGTDTNHARMDMEAQALVDGSWSPVEALQALTVRGAELLGRDGEVGTLTAGKLADVIALDGDPLRDACALRRVSFVMKAGEVVRADV